MEDKNLNIKPESSIVYLNSAFFVHTPLFFVVKSLDKGGVRNTFLFFNP